jgi:predicted RNA binding protein YcfA (HicA-like mRNA interferase family)
MNWPALKAKRVFAALVRIGWSVKRQSGTSHRVLQRSGWPDFVFAFHDNEEIGPRMMRESLSAPVFRRPIYEDFQKHRIRHKRRYCYSACSLPTKL